MTFICIFLEHGNKLLEDSLTVKLSSEQLLFDTEYHLQALISYEAQYYVSKHRHAVIQESTLTVAKQSFQQNI